MTNVLGSFLYSSTATTLNNFVKNKLSNVKQVDCLCGNSQTVTHANATHQFGFKLYTDSQSRLTLHSPYINRKTSRRGSRSLVTQSLNNVTCSWNVLSVLGFL